MFFDHRRAPGPIFLKQEAADWYYILDNRQFTQLEKKEKKHECLPQGYRSIIFRVLHIRKIST